MALPEAPNSRAEQYLAKIAGQETALPEAPNSRVEQYLEYIAQNGTVSKEEIAEQVSEWLEENIHEDPTVVIDASLSVSGAAADAKATGDEIADLKADLSESVSDLKSALTKHSIILTDNLMGIDVQQNLYPGAADWSGTWLNSDPAHMGVSDVTFNGYPTVYSSESWRRYCKNIPVEAGKTYTFECWLKHTTVGSAYIYLTHQQLTVDPATVSPASKQFNNTPSNVWVKLSLTFTCTTSGNVSPYALSGGSAFYIAKYNLVEGNSIFSLENSLAEKATKTDVSGIGDYEKYSFSLGSSLGSYWNNYIDKDINSGDKIRFIFDSYSGSSALSYVRLEGLRSDEQYETIGRINNPIRNGSVEAYARNNYTRLRVQFSRVTDESNVTGSILIATTRNLGITNDILSMTAQNVYHVAKDGSGDFTTFVEAINVACQHMDSIVYIGAGTYDLLSELGADYIKSAGSQKMGVVLKNRVHVICSAQTILEMDNDSTLYDTEAQYLAAKEYLSVINTGVYGCTLENAVIHDNNVRYSVHDDQGWSGDTPYTNKFINCTFVHKNGMYNDCIGGGLGENCNIEIRGCYFEADVNRMARYAYYHANNHTGITNAKGNLIVCNNYFANDGSFWLHKYGDSTEMSTALVSNNSFGSAPQITSDEGAQDNMRMIAWNNEVRS